MNIPMPLFSDPGIRDLLPDDDARRSIWSPRTLPTTQHNATGGPAAERAEGPPPVVDERYRTVRAHRFAGSRAPSPLRGTGDMCGQSGRDRGTALYVKRLSSSAATSSSSLR
jgi:hypothetical protein